MARRLVGSELIRWHLSREDTKLCVDPFDSQYSSNNLNPYVYKLLELGVSKRLYVGKRCAVVEFGARAGYLGRVLSENHANVVYSGFEPYPPIGKLFCVFEESCETVFCSELSHCLISKADIFVYADVLEHLTDPWLHLKRLFRVAKPGAELVVSIPNFFHHSALSLISNGRFTYEEWGVLDLTHMRFFGLQDILQMVAMAGWDVDNSSIKPAFDEIGANIVNSFRRGALHSWSDNKLTWRIESETDAISLGAYQYIFSSKKPF